MADEAAERIRIEAPPGECFAAAVDYERYPEWAKDVQEVSILDRDAEGRGRRVRFTASALGWTIRYTLDYDYAGAPETFSWTLVDGDLLRALDGSYRFQPDGSGTTVAYRLAVDLAIPLPGLVKRRAAGMIVQQAMRGLKRHVEGT